MSRPSEAVLNELLLNVSKAVGDIWHGLRLELERLGELERFRRFEIPVQQLFFYRQMRGIRVDDAVSTAFLTEAKAAKYAAMLRVGHALQVNPTGLSYKTVSPLLSKTDAASLAGFTSSRNAAAYFKIAAAHSHFAHDFRLMMQANRNIKTLLSLATSGGRIYPAFDTLGTVTARIQVSSPNIQQLKRAYRGSLCADVGMNAAYFDYAQFEPGILAQLAGPGRFRDLYNSGDVYSALSLAVFGDAMKRALAKQIFIAFCYGMELSSIARLLSSDSDLGEPERYAGLVASFFDQFPELDAYKNLCRANLRAAGHVGSVLGNRRVRLFRGRLRQKENGWAMNQSIQGTASLIFKDALLSLSAQFGENSILIPMHDAVWLQWPEQGASDRVFRDLAVSTMQGAFRRWCPDVTVRVKVSSFSE